MTISTLIKLVMSFAKLFISITNVVVQVVPIAEEAKEEFTKLKELVSTLSSGEKQLSENDFETLLEQTERTQERFKNIKLTSLQGESDGK